MIKATGTKVTGTVLIIVCLTACGNDPVIIDTRGVDMVIYERDKMECRQYAKEIKAGAKIARGAAIGAAIGGVIGAAVGNSGTAQRVAGAGAAKGGTMEGIRASQEKKQIVQNCLRGRGYKVLN